MVNIVLLRVKRSIGDNHVWILKWVNLHYNWINLMSVLNFLKQWVADYKCLFRTQPNIKDGVFNKKVNGFYPLTIFAKHSILDVWQGSEYASGLLKLLCRGWIQGKVDICQTDYSIYLKLRISPYSEVIHGISTFKLTKVNKS